MKYICDDSAVEGIWVVQRGLLYDVAGLLGQAATLEKAAAGFPEQGSQLRSAASRLREVSEVLREFEATVDFVLAEIRRARAGEDVTQDT